MDRNFVELHRIDVLQGESDEFETFSTSLKASNRLISQEQIFCELHFSMVTNLI